ncbi:alpha/beta-hydrolase [Agrocybe pediades]|nr:alpha/beta-hydrolase [Agrocybe pediades]
MPPSNASIPNEAHEELQLEVDHFVLDTTFEGDVLKASMNRYRPRTTARNPEDSGLILLLAHGMGFHKEHWEPTVQRLFELNRTNSVGNPKIVEAWSLDYPSHGEAAELNASVLKRRSSPLTIRSYTNAFHELYASGLLGEMKEGKQKIVLIGHSAGSVGITLLTTLFDDPGERFHKLILVEPTLWAPEVSGRMTETYRLVEQSTPLRRSKWSSKQAAHDWFRSRPPWSLWDARVLRLYTEHGLRITSTKNEKDHKEEVILQCDPVHEAFTFTEIPTVYEVIERLGTLCGAMPVHLIFGARHDMFSREAQDSIMNSEKGRVFASVSRIKGAGHMVVQEKPNQLAEALYQIVCDTTRSTRTNMRSKL